MKRYFSISFSLSLCTALVLSLTGCGEKKDSQPENATSSSGTSYLGAMAQAKKTSENVVNVASVQEAVNMFQATEGRYPKDLQEVVSADLLNSLPVLPQGYQYAYEAQTGKVKAVRVSKTNTPAAPSH